MSVYRFVLNWFRVKGVDPKTAITHVLTKGHIWANLDVAREVLRYRTINTVELDRKDAALWKIPLPAVQVDTKYGLRLFFYVTEVDGVKVSEVTSEHNQSLLGAGDHAKPEKRKPKAEATGKQGDQKSVVTVSDLIRSWCASHDLDPNQAMLQFVRPRVLYDDRSKAKKMSQRPVESSEELDAAKAAFWGVKLPGVIIHAVGADVGYVLSTDTYKDIDNEEQRRPVLTTTARRVSAGFGRTRTLELVSQATGNEPRPHWADWAEED